MEGIKLWFFHCTQKSDGKPAHFTLVFLDTKTEENSGRKAFLSSPTGGPHAGGSSESHIKGKIFCLPAMCRLQSSAVLQREIHSTWPIFKQIPLTALPSPFPCPKQGICIKPSQA